MFLNPYPSLNIFSTNFLGTSHQDAMAFCKGIGDMVLCPKAAYCPSETHDKLFLQREPFEGEQWAPAATTSDGVEHWVSIGTSPSACLTHEDLLLKPPAWASDGSEQKLKEHVLCCQKPSNLQKQQALKSDLDPIWMDSSHGWDGGSYDDATEFVSFILCVLWPFLFLCMLFSNFDFKTCISVVISKVS